VSNKVPETDARVPLFLQAKTLPQTIKKKTHRRYTYTRVSALRTQKGMIRVVVKRRFNWPFNTRIINQRVRYV